MTPAAFLELVTSLSVQTAVMIGVCAWLVRQTEPHDTGHRLWGTCHVMILTLTVSAVFLPHLRLLPHAMLVHQLPLKVVAASEEWLGRLMLWVLAGGSLLYGLAIAVGMVDLRRIVKAAKPLSCASHTRNDGVSILVSNRVATPFCWQMQRPVIVLPESAREFPPDELNAIIRHELAHLRAEHPVGLFLQRVVEMLLWFHPLVWWASHEAERHREFHCDHVANHNAADTASYLRSLLRLCETPPVLSPGLSSGLRFHGNQSFIRQRVERLMSVDWPLAHHDVRERSGRATLLMTAALMTCLWLPIDFAASDRSAWSPWPDWSAGALHELGIPARDYEIDGYQTRLQELIEVDTSEASSLREDQDD